RAATIDRQLSAFTKYLPGTATRLIRELADTDGPFDDRPPLSCLGFTENAEPTITLHFPIRCYAGDDQQVVDRLGSLLGEGAGSTLAAAISTYAGRPLAAGRGLVTYLSVRRSAEEGLRVVAYLSPEAYRVESPAGPRNDATPHGASVPQPCP